MQPQNRSTMSAQHASKARTNDEPLSDRAIVTLLGGLYIGGLSAFLATTYAISLLV